MFFGLAVLALLLEAAIGYPAPLLARIGHPVMWIGALITRVERLWNVPALSFAWRRANGVLAIAIVLIVTLALVLLLERALALLPALIALTVTAIIATSALAQRSLDDHVRAVADALQKDGLEGGRRAVSQIVGRDPNQLDEAGVARAAIESLAENFSDGVVAPTLYLALAGLPGAALYKAINTADSMIGHKSERYHAFGWAAARLDDFVNLPASRMSALWIIIAARILPGCSWRDAVDIVRADAKKHRSPNAGWPEAAMAGALGFKLSGPRVYGGTFVEEPYVGKGRGLLTATDIRRALGLYRAACAVQMAALTIVALGLWALT